MKIKNCLILILTFIASCGLFSCTKKGLSIDNGSGGNNISGAITFGDPTYLTGIVRIALTYENVTTVNLLKDHVTFSSSDGVSCSVGVENGTSLQPVLVLSSCTGTGTYKLVIESNTGITQSDQAAPGAESSLLSYDSTQPTVTIGTGEKVSTDHKFPITYTNASTIDLQSSHVAVTKSGNTSCDSHIIESGQSSTPKVIVPNCKGTGSISISISFGSATSTYGLTDSGALSTPVSVVSIPGDFNSNFAMAYSTRLLNRNYSGPLVKVRKAGTSTTQDIGVAASTDSLDTDALNTFLAGAEGYVETWYDQSGNGFHATQTTQSLQPKIQSNSTNSKYGIFFTPQAASANGLNIANTATQIGVQTGRNFEAATQEKTVYATFQAVQLSERYLLSNIDGASKHFSITQARPLHLKMDPLDTNGEIQVGGNPAFSNDLVKTAAKYDPATKQVSCMLNGGASATPAGIDCVQTTNNNTGTNFESGANFAIGRDGASSTDQTKHFSGYIHELFIYDESVSSYDEIEAELGFWE